MGKEKKYHRWQRSAKERWPNRCGAEEAIPTDESPLGGKKKGRSQEVACVRLIADQSN
jgi:hypothetical protein